MPTNTPLPTSTPTQGTFCCIFVTDTPTNTPVPSATTGNNQATNTPTTSSAANTATPTNTTAPSVQITSGNPTNTPTSNNSNNSSNSSNTNNNSQPSAPVVVSNNTTTNNAPPPSNNPSQNSGPTTSTSNSTTTAGLPKQPGKPSPVLRVTLERSLLRPGDTMRLRVSYAPNAVIHASANVMVVTRQRVTHTVRQTVNGKTVTKKVARIVSRNVSRQLSALDATDNQGKVTLGMQVPRDIVLSNGHTSVTVNVRATADNWHAQTTSRLAVSDMLLSLVEGRVKNCLQTQTVKVIYHPNAPLRIVLRFPNGHTVTLTAHANGQGNASAQVQLKYVKANSALRIGVQAIDASARTHRTEHNTFTVSIPQACQKQAPAATITIGS